MNIIPAIDLSEGKAVRLRQGDFTQKTIYRDDPVALAKEFASVGLKALHIVDLDGARLGTPQHLDLLEKMVAATGMRIDFGGGIRNATQMASIFDAGASQITIGSMAAKDPNRFQACIEEFGAERFILGADARKGMVAVSGWQEATTISLETFIGDYLALGVQDVLCTAIEKDGMLNGPDFNLYQNLMEKFPGIGLIASGGVSNAEDLKRLSSQGVPGVVVGKAFYEGRISLEALKNLNG